MGKKNREREGGSHRPMGFPTEKDSFFRWLVWGLEAPARWASQRMSIWVLLVLLAIAQTYLTANPIGEYGAVNILLAAVPLGAAYAAYSLSRETEAKWWQIATAVLVAGAAGFLLVFLVGEVPAFIIITLLFVLVISVAALFLKIASGGDASTGIGGVAYLKAKPKVGEVYWGEIVNSDGVDAKHRPVIITRVRGDNIRVFYTTSQEKREGQRGYIELTREGWDNGDGKRSFVLIRDSRILHISQLGSKLGELSDEDRKRLGMDAYHG